MRKMQLALLTLGATVLAGFVHVTPAAARDYPWCAQGGELDYPGECAYSTYQQCLASVSGRSSAPSTQAISSSGGFQPRVSARTS